MYIDSLSAIDHLSLQATEVAEKSKTSMMQPYDRHYLYVMSVWLTVAASTPTAAMAKAACLYTLKYSVITFITPTWQQPLAKPAQFVI